MFLLRNELLAYNQKRFILNSYCRLNPQNMNNLNVDWVKGILRQALDVWSNETPLNFREVDTKRVDIEVGFSR